MHSDNVPEFPPSSLIDAWNVGRKDGMEQRWPNPPPGAYASAEYWKGFNHGRSLSDSK